MAQIISNNTKLDIKYQSITCIAIPIFKISLISARRKYKAGYTISHLVDYSSATLIELLLTGP